MLPPATQAKVKIMGPIEEVLPVLEEFVAREQLPDFLSGGGDGTGGVDIAGVSDRRPLLPPLCGSSWIRTGKRWQLTRRFCGQTGLGLGIPPADKVPQGLERTLSRLSEAQEDVGDEEPAATTT